eukprot:scaffold5360_cov118-Isochrysis_galbana.AAC.8
MVASVEHISNRDAREAVLAPPRPRLDFRRPVLAAAWLAASCCGRVSASRRVPQLRGSSAVARWRCEDVWQGGPGAAYGAAPRALLGCAAAAV